MGLETYFELRNKTLKDTEIKTVAQYYQTYLPLLEMGHPSQGIDDLLMSCGEVPEKELIHTTDNKFEFVKPDQDTIFIINADVLNNIVKKIQPLYDLLTKYSTRIINNLSYDLDDSEIKKADRVILKDILYDIDENLDYEDIGSLITLFEVFNGLFASELFFPKWQSEEQKKYTPQFDIIYRRSY